MYAELDRDLKKQYRAAYTSEIANVARARQAISGFAAQCGFSEDEVSDIRLAAGEALSNAVEHGSETPARQIVVKSAFGRGELRIEIQDSGSAFTEPSDRSTVEPDDRGRGFGIFLMRRLMDEVAFARKRDADSPRAAPQQTSLTLRCDLFLQERNRSTQLRVLVEVAETRVAIFDNGDVRIDSPQVDVPIVRR